MARYNGQLLQNSIQTTFKTAGALWVITGTNTLRRLAIYELDLGQSTINTSTDTQVLWDVTRITTTSLLTGTSFTPNPLDAADAAALGNFSQNLTSEATPVPAAGSGLSLLSPPINQRGTFRWRALDDGDNLIIPSTTQSGVAVRVLSPSLTGSGQTAIGSIFWQE